MLDELDTLNEIELASDAALIRSCIDTHGAFQEPSKPLPVLTLAMLNGVCLGVWRSLVSRVLQAQRGASGIADNRIGKSVPAIAQKAA